MRKPSRKLTAAMLGVSAMLAQTVLADAQRFDFDKSHSDITFRVSHLGYSSTHGRFNDFDGQLMLDIEDLSKSSVDVKIKTASVETSWPKRNTHLRSADFFNVDVYPTMSFTSSAITMNSADIGKMTGELSMLNQTHPVTLDVKINKLAPHPRNGIMTIGITATAVLKRSEWDMDKFVPGIGDDIELRLDMEAAKPKE